MIGALFIFAISYVLIVTEKMDRTAAALLGAVAAIFLGYIPHHVALEYIDLEVFFLLVGMMIIVEILSQTGLFEWIAVVIAQRAKGNGLLILFGLTTATACLSAFLDNVTTVVLIIPITILITQILEIPAIPFLILEALFSNVGGTGTMIGDPPNILIGSKSHLTFNQFMFNLGPIVIVCMLVLLLLAFVLFRKQLYVKPEARERIMKAQPHRAITDSYRLKRALPLFILTLIGFCSSHMLHLEPGMVALAGALITLVVTKSNFREAFEKVEWETLFFLFGLFILVGALEHNGLFEHLGQWIHSVSQGNFLIACLMILWLSGILAACLGAVPVAIAMIPLVQIMITTFSDSMIALEMPEYMVLGEPMWWCLALGACFGGNGSLLGTTANVVVVQIARKNNYRISFTDFLRYGLPVMLITLLLSSFYIYFRYFVFQK